MCAPKPGLASLATQTSIIAGKSGQAWSVTGHSIRRVSITRDTVRQGAGFSGVGVVWAWSVISRRGRGRGEGRGWGGVSQSYESYDRPTQRSSSEVEGFEVVGVRYSTPWCRSSREWFSEPFLSANHFIWSK